jgi:glycosyltransferase involved in cell wall biosynthesis
MNEQTPSADQKLSTQLKIAVMRTLYLCYFGLREPLVQTQVLPYLRELVAGGIEVFLLTFESDKHTAWTVEEIEKWRADLAADGIRWFSLPYHKRPSVPATTFDVLAGTVKAIQLARRYDIDVLHARGHVPMLMAALAGKVINVRRIFDIRGFMPDEYVDAGVWPKDGWLYRLTRRIEKRLMKSADGFVVLTSKARDILFPGCIDTDQSGRPIEVIPCCVDHERFQQAEEIGREETRNATGVTDRQVFVYAGALGGWYLTEQMAEFLAIAHERNRNAFSLILTQSRPEMISESLIRNGLSPDDFLIRTVLPADVPRYLAAADAAISFIKPCYSKLSSSPTKIAEYLAAGLPVVCNAGIGDVDEVIEEDRTGVIVHELKRDGYLRALEELSRLQADPELSTRCRISAGNRFDLRLVGGMKYRRLYQRLMDTTVSDCRVGSIRRDDGTHGNNGIHGTEPSI